MSGDATSDGATSCGAASCGSGRGEPGGRRAASGGASASGAEMAPGLIPPGACADMGALRGAIDALDARLIALFALRQSYIARAAELKAANGLPARIPDRVEAVVAQVRSEARAAGLDPALYERIWREVIEAAIALEERALGAETLGSPADR